MPQATGRGSDNTRAGVYSSCCVKCPRPREHMASLDLVLLDADEVRCDAVAGHRGLDLFVVLLKSAHAGCRATWQQLQLIADGDRAIDQRAGDHRAEAAHGENPIDRKPGATYGWPRLDLIEHTVEGGDQLIHPHAGHSGHAHDFHALQRGSFQRLGHLGLDQLAPGVFDEPPGGRRSRGAPGSAASPLRPRPRPGAPHRCRGRRRACCE